MSQVFSKSARWSLAIICALAWFCWAATPGRADSITLKDGRVLEGRFARLPGVASNPLTAGANENVPHLPIWMCDNELTRIMVSLRQVRKDSAKTEPPLLERIKIPQPVATAGPRIARVGPIVGVKEFDEFGRRTISMNTNKGQVDVVQGITEVTPIWTKVEGVRTERSFIWDMRIATSSIPRQTLSTILHKYINGKDPQDRLRIVRLYVQSERYNDAREELKSIIADFPKLKQLETEVA